MGWGFRRSFSIGGMRLYASKSGLSASVGVKGLRLNFGPLGKSPKGASITSLENAEVGVAYRSEVGRAGLATCAGRSDALSPANKRLELTNPWPGASRRTRSDLQVSR